MSVAHINRIATAVPPHDVHQRFLSFATGILRHDAVKRALFERMSQKAEISHRYSWLAVEPADDPAGVMADGFYRSGDFPGTAERMRVFERYAPLLAQAAIGRLGVCAQPDSISHLLITCCTGFSAPGLDFQIIERCGLSPTIERTMVGFMGCYAAMNALKLARHIVRSEPHARVLVVNLELCSLHLQESADLNDILSFLIFSDGCAASIVSAEPSGIAMENFTTLFAPDTADHITWRIGDAGFLMELSGRVPHVIHNTLRAQAQTNGVLNPAEIDHWAVHPGGRSILDAVEHGLALNQGALAWSRDIPRRFGNMSSASVMFVLEQIMRVAERGSRGCAMSFGPGLVAECMRFTAAG